MNDNKLRRLAKQDIKLRNLAKQVVGISKETEKKKTSPYDTIATVRRVEGNTVYVHIPGGVDETPVEKTINAHKGDSVSVRVSGGRAFLFGNASSPPTDDRVANIARSTATTAHEKAVIAEETAEVADTNATSARKTAESILVYDNTYELIYDESTPPQPIAAHFTAYLYQGGIDVKTKYDEQLFTWALKTEAGEVPIIYEGHNYGYETEVDLSDCDYGAEVIGRFTEGDNAALLDSHGDNYTTETGQEITGRANGDQVRVRDLEVRTSLYDIEKLLVVGTSDEHLITIDTLTNYLATRIDSDKHFEYVQDVPSATWEIEHNLGKEPSVSVVDSAGNIVEGDYNYVNTNKVILSFSSAFSGKAYLN